MSWRRPNRSATWFRYRRISGWVANRSLHSHSCSSSGENEYEYSMLSTSQRAPGYRFQYQVPPTPSPASKTRAEKPAARSRYSMYSPAKPAPTTTASYEPACSLFLATRLRYTEKTEHEEHELG